MPLLLVVCLPVFLGGRSLDRFLGRGGFVIMSVCMSRFPVAAAATVVCLSSVVADVRITSQPQHIHVLAGDRAQLTCTVHGIGNTLCVFSWFSHLLQERPLQANWWGCRTLSRYFALGPMSSVFNNNNNSNSNLEAQCLSVSGADFKFRDSSALHELYLQKCLAVSAAEHALLLLIFACDPS